MRVDYRASRKEKKDRRNQNLQALVVTVMRGTQPLRFDGDETSQQRMALRAQRMRANGQSTVRWVLADNTEADVTVEQLEQALDLALQEQGKLWFA